MNGNRETLDKKIKDDNIIIDKYWVLEALYSFYVKNSITENGLKWFINKFNSSESPTLEADKEQIEDARKYFVYRTLYRRYYEYLFEITNGILRKYSNSDAEFKNFIHGKSQEIEMHEDNEINIENTNYYLNQADILNETLSELRSLQEKETNPELLAAIQKAIEDTENKKRANDNIIDTYNKCKEAEKNYNECVNNNDLAKAEEYSRQFASLKNQLPPILQKAIGDLTKVERKDGPEQKEPQALSRNENGNDDFERNPFTTSSKPSVEEIDDLIKKTNADILKCNSEIEELNRRFIEIKSNMNELGDENLISALEEIKKLNQQVNEKKREIAKAQNYIKYLVDYKKKLETPEVKKTGNEEIDRINNELAQIQAEREKLFAEFNHANTADEMPAERIDEIKKRLSELSKRKTELENKLNELQKIKKENTDFTPIGDQIKELSNEIADLKDERTELSEQLKGLNPESKEYQEKSQRIKQINEELQSKYQRLRWLMDNLNNNIQNFIKKMTKIKTSLDKVTI